MRIVIRSDIEAPRQMVWNYIVDPDRFPEFMEAVTRWEIAGPIRSGLGARFSMRVHVGWAELGGLSEVVEFDPPCDLAWTSITGVDHRGRWRLRRRGHGCTNLELRVAYHARGGDRGPPRRSRRVADREGAPRTIASGTEGRVESR